MENQENNQFDRLSYALGMSMGNNFKSSGIEKIVSSDFADGVAAVYEKAADADKRRIRQKGCGIQHDDRTESCICDKW